MNCSAFRKKLDDYLENNMILDMREAMDSHIEECEACRMVFEEEKAIDDAFRDAFKLDDVTFTSSRSSIMKSIDKNKYNRNPVTKLNIHFKRNRLQYLSSAAVLALAFFMAPYVAGINGIGSMSKGTQESAQDFSGNGSSDNRQMAGGTGTTSVSKEESAAKGIVPDASLKTAESELRITAFEKQYIPQFAKHVMNVKEEPTFATPWKDSDSGKYALAIEGRGELAREEGVASIIIKDKDNTNKRRYVLVESDGKYSPLFAEWADDENLLVIVGGAQGTVDVGGNVYLLNLNTCRTTVIYENPNNREQVTSIKKDKENGILELEVRIYTDEILNDYITDRRIIKFSQISSRNLPEVKSVYSFTNSINSGNYKLALQYLTSGFKENYQFKIGDIKMLKTMNISKIFDVSGVLSEDDSINQNYGYRIYFAEVSYKSENQEEGLLKSGTYYQKIIMVQEDDKSGWKIDDITTVPQS